MGSSRAEIVVQRQLDAYNAKDLEALLRVYAEDVEHLELSGKVLARGREELRERFRNRFTEPNLHAMLVNRIVCGNTVIDHERITRTFPEGPGTLELTAIYEVRGEEIARAWFVTGAKKLGES